MTGKMLHNLSMRIMLLFRFYIFITRFEQDSKKMQLDVDISPPANITTFRLDLTYMTFDLDPRDL